MLKGVKENRIQKYNYNIKEKKKRKEK